MDFKPNIEQQQLSDAVREFGSSLNEGMVERDRNETFSRDNWRKCAEFGILGLPVPTQYGGSGQDLTTTILAMEALGYSCRDNGLVFALNAQMWAVEHPLIRFGNDRQKSHYLPLLCNGEIIGAHAVTEPEYGSDAMSMKTRYKKDGDHYILNGSKTFITNGPEANLVLAFATLDPTLRSSGLSAFLIETGTPGMMLSRPIQKMGLRTSPMGEVVFQDCKVPIEN